jgi:SAM-dependent methyltransferase
MKPSRARWDLDAANIKAVVNVAEFAKRNSKHVQEYYKRTTHRDYKYLAVVTGRNAMHTRLTGKQPISFVSEAISRSDRVLELGCGKGGNLLALKRLKQSLSLHGEDITREHADFASLLLGLNSHVFARNFCKPSPYIYDVMFALESLCHLGSRARVRKMCLRVQQQLAPAGVFIIVDGFRADDYNKTCPAAQDAMKFAEFGFCAPNFPSVEMWIQEATAAGLELVIHRDLTIEALPYWTLGWKVGRLIIQFPRLVKAYMHFSPLYRTETVANLVSVCAVAPALVMGSAKYGLLKFKKVS